MTHEYSALREGPEPVTMIDLENMTADERAHVRTIDIPSDAHRPQLPADVPVTGVYYIDGRGPDPLLTLSEVNTRAIADIDFEKPNVFEDALPATSYHRFRYYAFSAGLHRDDLAHALVRTELGLRELTTTDGARWLFDADAYERVEAGLDAVAYPGARIPPEVIDHMPIPGPDVVLESELRALGIVGDIDVVLRYLRYHWGPAHVLTCHGDELALVNGHCSVREVSLTDPNIPVDST